MKACLVKKNKNYTKQASKTDALLWFFTPVRKIRVIK